MINSGRNYLDEDDSFQEDEMIKYFDSPLTDSTESVLAAEESSACRERLLSRGLIPQDSDWEPKTIGIMPGLIYFKPSKGVTDKTVFIKEYRHDVQAGQYLSDIQDYAAFMILQQCGGRVPKVKLKGTDSHATYSFSTYISESKKKHPERKYEYQDLRDGDFDVSDNGLVAGSKFGLFRQKQPFKIDKLSVARFFILGAILNICDLHDQNVGFVVSSEGTAKLGCVDFSIKSDELEIDEKLMLDNFVRVHYSRMTLDCELDSLLDMLRDDHYFEAFNKIEKNFMTACDHAIEKINGLKWIEDQRKQGLEEQIDIWKQNFLRVNELVNRSKFITPRFSQEK